jgi:hypothetical protein
MKFNTKQNKGILDKHNKNSLSVCFFIIIIFVEGAIMAMIVW